MRQATPQVSSSPTHTPSPPRERTRAAWLGRAAAASVLFVGVALTFLLVTRAHLTRAQSGPDLTAEISIDPALPDVGEEVTVSVLIKNQGDVAIPSGDAFYTYLYVEPDEPPDPDTPDNYYWQWFTGLGAGEFHRWSRAPYTFTAGCDHLIYVWVDRDDDIGEINEGNNLVSHTVCAGVDCEEDLYEADDTCSTASWFTPGATQPHTLCPVRDHDWVKFTATGGLTYTIEASNLGAHADPQLYLWESCSGPYHPSTGPLIEWYAPDSGVIYVEVEHRQLTHGPLASYDLTITSSGGSGDVYEPDNECTMARDIPADGSRQTHLFQAAGDRDWVKFTVDSGDAFSIVADNTGPGVNPLISLYSSCGQAFSDVSDQAGQLSTSAATGQTYYARLVNQDPNTYGPDAHYDLAVTAIACAPDGFEDDDDYGTATQMFTTGQADTHNICPKGDEDWVSFAADAGTLYVLQTAGLGIAADTHLYLYDTDGVTQLAQNDDYGYTLASRIIWRAPAAGTYYAKVNHHNPNAAGADTHYDLSIHKGVCIPDDFEADNGRLEAVPLITDGQAQAHSFCADPLSVEVADQDWVRFTAVGGAPYLIKTANLGANCDTVLDLYDGDGVTIASNDDQGPGGASAISATLSPAGTYYVRVTNYNSSHLGSGTEYDLSITGEIPPTPTPTPSPTPTPTPTPSPTPSPSEVETLILVNRERVESLHTPSQANALMGKLQELADHESVEGLVLQVETDASVASAYDTWTADEDALLDTDKANAVAGAVRNLVLTYLDTHANVDYIVIVGDDRVIPFRRVPEGDLSKTEEQYATSVTTSTTQWAASQDNMILTDDYYADQVPTDWEGTELYIPDYAIGRLIEQPGEIMAFIDAFLAEDTIQVNNVLVTAYDFVQDAGNIISLLFENDNLTTDDTLVGHSWSGADFRDRQLNATPRFDVQSINGHADHTSEKTPDQDDVSASEISTSTIDLSGALVFSIGCHSGFNDAGSLDLAQAFAQKQANYVANTGFGWGGPGVVYSEALMKNYARELLRETSTQIGPALTAAKQNYYDRARSIGPYDVKILMESTLYGLPMYGITSGGTLAPEDPFPSATITSTAPSAFGEVNVGQIGYGLGGSFGVTDTVDGTSLSLDGWAHFSAGEPVQPLFFADASAPAAGSLHGAVFLGGTYSDTQSFDPVIALPINEYVTSTTEPAFDAAGWYPPVPFQVRTNASVSTTAETVVTLLGQYSSGGLISASGTERLYDDMSFSTYYSSSSDRDQPTVTRVDGVLNQAGDAGLVKVGASDASGVIRVVMAYTDGQGDWQSLDLTHSDTTAKWTGVFSATAETRYFVQAVDGAGNVAIDDNKGRYHSLSQPLPLVESAFNRVYLPLILKGG